MDNFIDFWLLTKIVPKDESQRNHNDSSSVPRPGLKSRFEDVSHVVKVEDGAALLPLLNFVHQG